MGGSVSQQTQKGSNLTERLSPPQQKKPADLAQPTNVSHYSANNIPTNNSPEKQDTRVQNRGFSILVAPVTGFTKKKGIESHQHTEDHQNTSKNNIFLEALDNQQNSVVRASPQRTGTQTEIFMKTGGGTFIGKELQSSQRSIYLHHIKGANNLDSHLHLADQTQSRNPRPRQSMIQQYTSSTNVGGGGAAGGKRLTKSYAQGFQQQQQQQQKHPDEFNSEFREVSVGENSNNNQLKNDGKNTSTNTMNLFDNEADLFFKGKGNFVRAEEEVSKGAKKTVFVSGAAASIAGRKADTDTATDELMNPEANKNGSSSNQTTTAAASAASTSATTATSKSVNQSSSNLNSEENKQRDSKVDLITKKGSSIPKLELEKNSSNKQRTSSPEFKHDIIYVSKTKTTKDSFQKGNIFLTVVDENQSDGSGLSSSSTSSSVTSKKNNNNSGHKGKEVIVSKTITDLQRNNICITDFLITEDKDLQAKIKSKQKSHLLESNRAAATSTANGNRFGKTEKQSESNHRANPHPQEHKDLIISYSADWEIMRKNGFKSSPTE